MVLPSLSVSAYIQLLYALRYRSLHITHSLAADAGSVYEPYPTLTYTWDPNANAQPMHRRTFSKSTTGLKRGPSIDLGPHPADPYSTAFPTQGDSLDSPAALSQDEQGQELWVYCGNGGYVGILSFLLAVYAEIMLPLRKDIYFLAIHDSYTSQFP